MARLRGIRLATVWSHQPGASADADRGGRRPGLRRTWALLLRGLSTRITVLVTTLATPGWATVLQAATGESLLRSPAGAPCAR